MNEKYCSVQLFAVTFLLHDHLQIGYSHVKKVVQTRFCYFAKSGMVHFQTIYRRETKIIVKRLVFVLKYEIKKVGRLKAFDSQSRQFLIEPFFIDTSCMFFHF